MTKNLSSPLFLVYSIFMSIILLSSLGNAVNAITFGLQIGLPTMLYNVLIAIAPLLAMIGAWQVFADAQKGREPSPERVKRTRAYATLQSVLTLIATILSAILLAVGLALILVGNEFLFNFLSDIGILQTMGIDLEQYRGAEALAKLKRDQAEQQLQQQMMMTQMMQQMMMQQMANLSGTPVPPMGTEPKPTEEPPKPIDTRASLCYNKSSSYERSLRPSCTLTISFSASGFTSFASYSVSSSR